MLEVKLQRWKVLKNLLGEVLTFNYILELDCGLIDVAGLGDNLRNIFQKSGMKITEIEKRGFICLETSINAFIPSILYCTKKHACDQKRD